MNRTKIDLLEDIAERYYIQSLLAYMAGEYETVWEACAKHGYIKAIEESASYGYGFRDILDCGAFVLHLAKQDGHA